jgi:hypothetical protein
MGPGKVIIVSVIAYVVLFGISWIAFLNMKFSGDAAGSGMEKGLTYLFGLGILFLIGMIITGFGIYFFGSVTQQWIKWAAFVPVLLPIVVFSIEYFEIGRSRGPSLDDPSYRLTFEVRSSEELHEATFLYRSSTGSSSSKLNYIRLENGSNVYEKSNIINIDNSRKVQIRSDKFNTEQYELEIPEEPSVIPFTGWKMLYESKSDGDTIRIDFRYKITASN